MIPHFKMKKIYKDWFIHNLLGHPLSEMAYWLLMRFSHIKASWLSIWIHDATCPSKSHNEESKKSNLVLSQFSSYLKTLDINLDLNSFDKHVKKGMYFDSSIPKGYGVGSSGALVAAVYEKYANNKITVLENLTREKLLVLKAIFSKMESFFHGKSSGLDPLNSYLSIPILIKSKNDINVTGIPGQKSKEIGRASCRERV